MSNGLVETSKAQMTLYGARIDSHVFLNLKMVR